MAELGWARWGALGARARRGAAPSRTQIWTGRVPGLDGPALQEKLALGPLRAFVSNPDRIVVRSMTQTVRIELVADGLMTPWALAFLPDGRMLVTERDGRLRMVDHGTLSEPVTGTPTPHVQQDGGYLDVEVHPDYARNRWIYLAYSEAQPGYVPPPHRARLRLTVGPPAGHCRACRR